MPWGSLKELSIRGFKSIEVLDGFALQNLNVLIGANGSGKSNFIDFFRLLNAMSNEALQSFVNDQGGADGFFFLGPKQTRVISARLCFAQNVYEFDLKATANSGLQIATECVQYTGGRGLGKSRMIGSGSLESKLKALKDEPAANGPGRGVPGHVHDAASSWTVYHFHDTSMLAPVRRPQSVRDAERLRPDASNLAAFLLRLKQKQPNTYMLIRDMVRLVAPFFDDFLLRPEERGGDEQVRLEWQQKGSDFPFQAAHLSDGTIRFICLTTALLQPQPPAAILIDEPELGLHPYAISLLAELVQSTGERTQIIISTQSPALLDHFDAENIVVVNRVGSASTFERLDAAKLKDWLNEYSLGELWEKNVVRGGPASG